MNFYKIGKIKILRHKSRACKERNFTKFRMRALTPHIEGIRYSFVTQEEYETLGKMLNLLSSVEENWDKNSIRFGFVPSKLRRNRVVNDPTFNIDVEENDSFK